MDQTKKLNSHSRLISKKSLSSDPFDLNEGWPKDLNPFSICGVDEVGRGCLAGPVVSAAVCFKNTDFLQLKSFLKVYGVNDSKKMSETQREKAFCFFQNHVVVGYGFVESGGIDRMNILNATLYSMEKAVEELDSKLRELECENRFAGGKNVHIDGNRVPRQLPEAVSWIGGDGKLSVISMASIFAKVTRDRLMVDLDKKFPGYGFSNHKGYGTAMHLECLKKNGVTPIHRKSFAPVREINSI